MPALQNIHALGRPASEKRQGRKSRWVGQRRCRGIYGGLAVGCGAGRYDRSGRTGRIGSKVGCALGRERVNGVLRDTIDAVSGQSGVSTKLGDAAGREPARMARFDAVVDRR